MSKGSVLTPYDQEYGSKRLLKMIADAPAFEDLPEKYQIPSCTGSCIRRRKVGSEAKYPNRVGTSNRCGWNYCTRINITMISKST